MESDVIKDTEMNRDKHKACDKHGTLHESGVEPNCLFAITLIQKAASLFVLKLGNRCRIV